MGCGAEVSPAAKAQLVIRHKAPEVERNVRKFVTNHFRRIGLDNVDTSPKGLKFSKRVKAPPQQFGHGPYNE